MLPTPTKPRSTVHDGSVYIVVAKDASEQLKNIIASDLSGRYPVKSARGHKYMFVMYDFNTDYINAVPIKSRMLRHIEGEWPQLDNEVSKELIAAIENHKLVYQLASLGDHTRIIY